jgi:hypothetical protein
VLTPATGQATPKEDTVKYMLLIYSEPNAYASLSKEENDALFGEYFTFTQKIQESGEFVAGDPLQGIETATTVRTRDNKRALTDGPFAETKEVLGGYYIVDVKDLDRALELAEQIPGVRRELESIEVRPIMPVG